jgi:hypothetical protein
MSFFWCYCIAPASVFFFPLSWNFYFSSCDSVLLGLRLCVWDVTPCNLLSLSLASSCRYFSVLLIVYIKSISLSRHLLFSYPQIHCSYMLIFYCTFVCLVTVLMFQSPLHNKTFQNIVHRLSVITVLAKALQSDLLGVACYNLDSDQLTA